MMPASLQEKNQLSKHFLTNESCESSEPNPGASDSSIQVAAMPSACLPALRRGLQPPSHCPGEGLGSLGGQTSGSMQ